MAPSRIDELRRRVQNDPASIAFAQLAEEYRRAGQTEEAVKVCHEGLTRHPGYLSARVTLGRALLDLGRLPEAREELEFVVAEAPENLAAVRGLAEIAHREGQTAEALTYYQRAQALARHDPEIEEIVEQLTRQLGAAAAGSNGGLSFEEAHQELLSAAERLPVTPPQASPEAGRDADLGSTAPFDFDRLVSALGSPSAPPQVDAAIDGRATTVALDLPGAPALGLDPFAALEAELRAHDAVPGGAKVAPWESAYAEATEDAPTVGGPDDGERVEPRPPELDGLEPTWVDGGMAADDPPASMADFAAPDDLPAGPSSPAVTDFSSEAAAQASPREAAEHEPAREGVLDELESWLTTLQNRSSH